jgi:U3 small nucleolar ribonucleoprotein protein IMP4
VFVKIPRQVQLAEVGPRFDMKRTPSLLFLINFGSPTNLLAYEIRQGTFEQSEAEREWVLAHYARTSKKRSVLSGPGSYSSASEHANSSKKAKR